MRITIRPADDTYTPRFVTQTDEPAPWDDCLWASGAMLIDKLTLGAVHPDRRMLRLASRDLIGGSTFADLRRGVARLYGVNLQSSPYGGDLVTWPQLLERLARGAGAVIAGTYGALGQPYTRWSPRYAANPLAGGHAMYVERYDPVRDAVWLMDPLARGGYGGEWVPQERVWNFIWKRGQFVYAIVTPVDDRALATSDGKLTAGYEIGTPELAPGPYRAGEQVELSLPLANRPPSDLPALNVGWRWDSLAPTADGSELAMVSTELAPNAGDEQLTELPAATGSGLLSLIDDRLTASISLPDAPGLWQLSLHLTEADGRPLAEPWQQEALQLDVWGKRGAIVRPLSLTTAAGVFALADLATSEELGEQNSTGAVVTVLADDVVPIQVAVRNTGVDPWTALTTRAAIDEGLVGTELIASWLTPDGSAAPSQSAVLVAAPDEEVVVTFLLRAPSSAGSHALSFTLAHAGVAYPSRDVSTPALAVDVSFPLPPMEPPERVF